MIDLGVPLPLDFPLDLDLFPLPFLPLEASDSSVSHDCSCHSISSCQVESSRSAFLALGLTGRALYIEKYSGEWSHILHIVLAVSLDDTSDNDVLVSNHLASNIHCKVDANWTSHLFHLLLPFALEGTFPVPAVTSIDVLVTRGQLHRTIGPGHNLGDLIILLVLRACCRLYRG